ncbi:hypothetical protein LX32DRAFT_426025 [Colletotrichum zoysiae]|uniref:Uncharacterized protein n=1 Tax=Colletotrichum zoysiae TaxID=1216348 RepID=A0AAD9M3P1_9PEZI|nr:hypothetical protein LX32DRAFT_426025 [Colletotrichum zoysiae]
MHLVFFASIFGPTRQQVGKAAAPIPILDTQRCLCSVLNLQCILHSPCRWHKCREASASHILARQRATEAHSYTNQANVKRPHVDDDSEPHLRSSYRRFRPQAARLSRVHWRCAGIHGRCVGFLASETAWQALQW